MGSRKIDNRRAHDTNIMKNAPVPKVYQEFTWPTDVVTTYEEREAVIAALESFIQMNDMNLGLQGRDSNRDRELQISAARVLGRIG